MEARKGLKMLNVMHSADWHFQNDPDLLTEVIRTTDHLIVVARSENPDVIVLAGDTVDEFQSRIRLDSDAARAAISAVTRMAEVAPVVIPVGTKSHDRGAPYIFSRLRTRYPVFVSSEPCQVALTSWTGGSGHTEYGFVPVENPDRNRIEAVFTLLPSLDKSWMAANFGGIREGNASWRELLHDMLSGFGIVNEQFDCPRILVGHGMLTGSVFSSGQEAIGEDLEFGLDTLRAAKCDYVALGHVHKFQSFGKDVAYSGSPGRMNFGEPEEKGALLVGVERGADPVLRFVPTPAREFLFWERDWTEADAAAFASEIDALSEKCSGRHVRVRYTIPESFRHAVDRDAIEKALLDAGAAKVKVEAQILPTVRSRAEGISKAVTLPEKVKRYGVVVGVEIPPRVLEIASVIEGFTVEELKARFP
jgi:exonuclease SbcD